MAAVYTQRLILQSGLSGAAVPVLTVPAGTQAIFTCVNWVTGANALNIWASLVHSASGAKFAAAQSLGATFDYTSYVIEGRWAFYAGEVILAATGGPLFDLIVTGYLLTLP